MSKKPKTKQDRLNRSDQVVEIDASGKILGRLASQVCVLLMGKNQPSYRPNVVKGSKVYVVNSAKIKVSGNKLASKIYYRHSGHLGNLKSETLGSLLKRRPAEVLRRAIKGMLPKNRLQKIYLKNLVITK